MIHNHFKIRCFMIRDYRKHTVLEFLGIADMGAEEIDQKMFFNK